MARKMKPTRRGETFSTQMDPAVVDGLREYACARGETLRAVLERAIRRELASPPPAVVVPPFPPEVAS